MARLTVAVARSWLFCSSSAALSRAHGDLEVEGGVVERDANGEPTGILREEAAWQFSHRFLKVPDDEYVEAFEGIVQPAIAAFEPDLLLVSAGFDAGADDLIGGMRVTEKGFAEMASRARGMSERVALVLEGGYTLETLPGFVRAVAEVF